MFNYYLDAFRYNYANFNGRARRSEYWYFQLFNIIILIALLMLGGGFSYGAEGGSGLGMTPYFIYALASFIPNLALVVRRLHDVGKSGWFLLISLIPLIGVIWLFILYCTEGTTGPNQYGEDPKNASADYGTSDDEIGSIGNDL